MIEPAYNIADLPDYAAFQQLARALWRNGSVRGASVLVGAGLSKNAERPGEDTPEPPLWSELMTAMVERLYPHDTERAPKNSLRIAEEYRTYFGQAGLDDFLRTRFPDKSWSPGQLHGALLSLPWGDVLTTNWDTLLERAEHASDQSYEIVRTEADLTHARSPRIVKLHGTIGDAGPLIFAEEDYRTYPVKHAAFVNLARQIFIENELCLVGFSGDDPNFLQWAGWVRDHLGGSARRIYLVGNLRLERATRKYLEAHNIAPIDFAPLVAKLAPHLQHAAATRIFIDELSQAKPPLQNEWKLTQNNQFPFMKAGADAHQRVHKDNEFAAGLLRETIPLLKADRENYPGWLVCPLKHRRIIAHAGDTNWLVRKPVLDLLEPKFRAEALFEILWHRTVAFAPLDIRLADALAEIVDNESADIDPNLCLQFTLALMRDARVSRDEVGLMRWAAVIDTRAASDAAVRQEAEYQWCLRARDRMDFAALATRLAKLTLEDPIWKLRRAALHTELGEYAKATKFIKDATAELERRHRLDRNSLVVKSHLAWASWINRACDMWNAIGRADRPPLPRNFKQLDIDPRREIEHIENQAAEIVKKGGEDAVAVQPAFEPGHYREGSATIHMGSDPGVELLYELDQLTEHTGLPLRINRVDLCASVARSVVEAAPQVDPEWYVWLFRALQSHSDKSFERYFSRIATARIPVATVSTLLSTVDAAVTVWALRVKEARSPELRDDLGCAIDALRSMLMVLSRLTVRMTPDQAAQALRRAIELAKEPLVTHPWLVEAIGELAKYAVKAIPPTQRGAFALTVLEFPLPSEKSVGKNHRWPQVVFDIWNVPPAREAGDTRWDHRVGQLLTLARRGNTDREQAISQLAYLAVRGSLKPDETTAFGNALWSDLDAQEAGLPANTVLNAGAFLRLPAMEGIDRQARVSARLLGTNLRDVMRLSAQIDTRELSRKANHFASIANAVQFGLVIPSDHAEEMFDEIVTWELQQVKDSRDPFAISFAKSFNDTIRLAAGNLLTVAVVPAMRADQRTVARAEALIAFIRRVQSWSSVQALPRFLPSAADLTTDVISIVRAGLLAPDPQQVGNAAEAIVGWAELVRSSALAQLPQALIERLMATIEVRRSIGLPAMLAAALKLLHLEFLGKEDIKRLTDTISEIRGVRYEDIALNTMEAVTASLVRAECVKLAAALKEHIADDVSLQAWLDEAKDDPLPEVRFSLTEPHQDDTE
ncbi:SIR2 family protein [Bradyrhizobium brasilense]|uniref:SIR2 family NAD-dependent protein deacylase n=1 Tax=Bradyrhizobium brasilense TaxID=1419277 RepID=UPI0028780F21|nr:SIR2 family protein [Bradyrhizobium brasilense]MCP3415681.1 SIR2 family protein [Bradyrhizobium brasilense]